MKATRRRVLFVDQADFLGGAERILAEMIARMDSVRFECMIATNPSSPLLDLMSERGLGHVRVFAIPLPRISRPGPLQVYRAWRAVRSLRKVVRDMRIDLMITNTVRSHVIGALVTKRTPAKLVWYLHDDTLPHRVFRALRDRASLIICVSNYLVEFYGLKQRHVVVHNGIDLGKFRPVHSGVADRLIVVNAGRIVRWKGQDVFINAVAKIARSFSEAEFLIVGDPGSGLDRKGIHGGGLDYLGELTDLVRDHGLEDRIRFLGELSSLSDLLGSAHLVVHTSTQPEPFGLVILEGMATGLPVIASNDGGPKEIVQDGVTGFLVRPGDVDQLSQAISKLLSSSDLRRDMGAAGRERAEKLFDLVNQVRRFEEAIGSI